MSPILTLALDLALTLALSLTTTLTIIAAQHALTSAAANLLLRLTLKQLPHLPYHSHYSYCQTRIVLVSLTLTLSSILVVLTLTLALTLTLTFQEPAEVPLEGGASPYEVDRVIIRVSGNCSLTVGI